MLWMALHDTPRVLAASAYTFHEDSAALHLDVKSLGRSNAWADLNGDRRVDVVAVSHDQGVAVFFQTADGLFQDVTKTCGARRRLPTYGVLLVDADNDGDRDIFLVHGGFVIDPVVNASARSLFLNDGTGRFSDATLASGLAGPGRGFGAVAVDYDRDGWLDLYFTGYDAPNVLFHNKGGGVFRDVTEDAGAGAQEGREGYSTSVVVLDYDRDGWDDLFVAQRDWPDAEHPLGNSVLLHNQGDGTFVNRAPAAGVQGYGGDFVATCGDYDGDGWPDLYVATFNWAPNGVPETSDSNRLYLNRRDGTFRDATAEAGVAYIGGTMGLASGDFDNDGWVDLYLGTGGPFALQQEEQILFHNEGNVHFVPVQEEAGVSHLGRGHGAVFVDFDEDGDLDLFHSLGGFYTADLERSALYRNSGGPAHWIAVELESTHCNRDGVGAVVEVTAQDRGWQQELRAGDGFGSMPPLRAWFGLGATAAIERVTVTWPCGERQSQERPGVDGVLHIQEQSARHSGTAATVLAVAAGRLEDGAVWLAWHDPFGDERAGAYAFTVERLDGAAFQVLRGSRHPDDGGSDHRLVDADAPRDRGVCYRVFTEPGLGVALIGEVAVAAWDAPSEALSLRVYPNPFREHLQVQYTLRAPASVTLAVYSVDGRLVRHLEWGEGSAGRHVAAWDGTDMAGARVAAGVYRLSLSTGRRVVTRPIVRHR